MTSPLKLQEIDLLQRQSYEDAYAEGYLAASQGFECMPGWFSPTIRRMKQVDEHNYSLYAGLVERFKEGHAEWFS